MVVICHHGVRSYHAARYLESSRVRRRDQPRGRRRGLGRRGRSGHAALLIQHKRTGPTMRLKPLTLALTLALAPAAHAANLSDTYRDAQAYDAQYAAARAACQAGQEKSVQGRAGLLPSVNLGANDALQQRGYHAARRRCRLRSPTAVAERLPTAVPQAESGAVRAVQGAGEDRRDAIEGGRAGPDPARRAGLLRRAGRRRTTLAFMQAQKAAITEQLAPPSATSRSAPPPSPTPTKRRRATTSRSRRKSPKQNNLQHPPARAGKTHRQTGRHARLAGREHAPENRARPHRRMGRARRRGQPAGRNPAHRQDHRRPGSPAQPRRPLPTLDAVAGYTINNGQNFGAQQVTPAPPASVWNSSCRSTRAD